METFTTKSLVSGSVLALSLFGFSAGANADYSVDLFNGLDQSVVDTTNGDGAVFDIDGPPDAPRLDILGGYRDIGIDCISGCSALQSASQNVTGGVLNFNSPSLAVVQGVIRWDGLGGVGIGNPGGFDITDGGLIDNFLTTTIFSDGGDAAGNFWNFTVRGVDTAGKSTDVTLIATKVPDPIGPPIIPSPFTNVFSFAGFSDCGNAIPNPQVLNVTCSDGAGGTGVDITDLKELTIFLNVDATAYGGGALAASLDLTLDGIVAVPAPSVLALMGAGLLGLGLARRRRRVA